MISMYMCCCGFLLLLYTTNHPEIQCRTHGQSVTDKLEPLAQWRNPVTGANAMTTALGAHRRCGGRLGTTSRSCCGVVRPVVRRAATVATPSLTWEAVRSAGPHDLTTYTLREGQVTTAAYYKQQQSSSCWVINLVAVSSGRPACSSLTPVKYVRLQVPAAAPTSTLPTRKDSITVSDKPIVLFRDTNSWCPFCERVSSGIFVCTIFLVFAAVSWAAVM